MGGLTDKKKYLFEFLKQILHILKINALIWCTPHVIMERFLAQKKIKNPDHVYTRVLAEKKNNTFYKHVFLVFFLGILIIRSNTVGL